MLAIYTRLSQEDEESNSIINQIQEGKAFAKLHNFEKLEVYNEGEGVSGSLDIESRPILSEMVKDINEGKITAIWARNQNRIERSNFVYGFFVKLVKKFDVKVFFADKEVDFNDPSQKMLGTILSGINEYQLELQTAQIKKVLRSRAEEGKISGHICYGYMRDENGYQVPHSEKSELVKEIFRRYEAGEGIPTITEDFNKREIPPIFVRSNKSGNWSPAGLYTLIRNTTYIGDKNHAGKIYSVPPIIDRDLFNRVQAKLKIGSMKQSTRHFYVLNQLLTCGTCGSKMSGRSFGSDLRKYYMCTKKRYGKDSCSSSIIRMNELDKLIWNTLFSNDSLYKEVKKAYVDGDNSAEKAKAAIDIKHFTKVREKYEKQLPRIKEMVLARIYTIKEGMEMKQEIESNITAAMDKILEAEARINDLLGERFLLQSFRKDMGKVIIPANVVEAIFSRSEDESMELSEEQALLGFEEEQKEFKIRWSKSQVINSMDNEETKEFNKSRIGNDPKEKSRIIKMYLKNIVIKSLKVGKFEITIEFKLPIGNKVLLFNHLD